MSSIDHRTRMRSDIRSLSATEAIEDVLIPQLGVNEEVTTRGFRRMDAKPLTISAGNERFTLTPFPAALRLVRGGGAVGLSITMSEEALSDAVQDVSTLSWEVMMGRASLAQGTDDELAQWDPILRCLLDGEPVYEPGTLELRDAQGMPLPLDRQFQLDEQEDAGHFLSQAGYLHVRDVFTAEEMAAVSGELDAAISTAERDDGESWWAHTADGWYPARVLGFNRKSQTLRDLLRSDRFRSLVSIVDDDLVQSDVESTNMAEGLLKKIGVTEGISDVSWHKDCGPGGHSYGCSGMTIGIQITSADRRSGELGVMAGSNRANVPGLRAVSDFGLQRVALSTRAGDCTIHCSCTMHMSRPPETAERRVVYTGLSQVPLPEDRSLLPSEEQRRKNRAALEGVVGRSPGDRAQLPHLPLPN
jgi:hypothetical protein